MCGHGRPVGHVLHWSALWCDAIWHGTTWATEGGGIGIAIIAGDAVGGGALGTRGVGLGLQARALEQMLLLARGVLRSDLLAIDALDRQAFVVFCGTVWSATVTVLYSQVSR